MDSRKKECWIRRRFIWTLEVYIILLSLTTYAGAQVQSEFCPANCKNQTCTDPYTDQLGCTYGCVDGYRGEKCLTECPINCKTCKIHFNAGRVCYSCKEGFNLTDTYKECTCNNQCSGGCNTGCTRCSSGYYLEGTECRQCPTGCSECTSKTTCTACYTGYFLTNSHNTGYYITNSQCQSCTFPCSACISSGSNQCTACKSGYYLYGSICHQCPSLCSDCNSSMYCTACRNAFYLEHGQCIQCPGGCRKCLSETVCTKCYNADYSPKGMCQTCVDGLFDIGCNKTCPYQCQSCTSALECQSCKSGYYNSDTVTNCANTKPSCPSNCEKCKSDTECATCIPGFYLTNTEKDCSKSCPYRCATCDSATLCTRCVANRQGSVCDDCVDGKFGENCDQNCLHQCRICTTLSVCTACQDGFYNTMATLNCSLVCLSGCKTCTNGNSCTLCKPNFLGDNCDSCMNGFWSSNCDGECPNTCLNSQCHRLNGSCVACPSGYTGDYCEICIDGLYGDNCDRSCSPNCQNTACARHTGVCNDGCINDNFNGAVCVTCKYDFYGDDCTEKCPRNCFNNICKQADGTCYNCVKGFAGKRCEMCFGGKYGVNCSLECSQFCSSAVCSRNDGACSPCMSGYYGAKCLQSCPSNCKEKSCTQTNGNCLHGCAIGYSGDRCCVQSDHCKTCSTDQICQSCTSDYYGSDCTVPCPDNCNHQGCSKDDGSCFSCKSHHFGDKCQHNCSLNCAYTEGTSRCHYQSGICSGECVTGFYGEFCEKTCVGNCNGHACNKDGTGCLQGCKPGFTGQVCSEEEKTSGSPGPIAGGAVGSVVVLVSIAVIIVVLLRRKKGRAKQRNEFLSSPAPRSKPVVPAKPTTLRNPMSKAWKAMRRPHVSEPDATFNADAGESDEGEEVHQFSDVKADIIGDMYGNIGNIRKRIAVVELEQYVASTPRQEWVAEYKTFPRGLIKPYGDSQLPENVRKNRYDQVYPYDENRVKLMGRSTDYVNASYINGYNKERAYIASLGPTRKAMEEFSLFWDMVWQKDVEKIVMATNLVENTNMKCQQYWPEVTGTLTYGNITVMNLHENVSAEYTVRNFSVSKGNQKKTVSQVHFTAWPDKWPDHVTSILDFHNRVMILKHELNYGNKKRTVSQVHFTAWPDKGVPDHVTSIVEFHNRVKSLKHELNGPILVHCSAGIGRTGTYVALDILTEEGEATGHVDIYNCVKTLRQQRVNMVQTEAQYIYLHKAVAHNLTYNSRPIPSAEFQKVTADTSDEEFETKFERLKRTLEEITVEEDNAKRKSKSFKELNRNGTDIPGQRYRPLLFKYQSPDDYDYINAVYINSFKTKNHFITAQTPLPATVVDFIKLILQENCTCVVNLEPESLKTKTLGEYLPPDDHTVTHGQFQLTTAKLISPDAYTVRQVTIIDIEKTNARENVIHCFQFNAWPGKENVPRDPVAFMRFIKDVKDKPQELMKKDDEKRPILIHCLSGAIKCGLFCAVHNAIEKMENEQEVSIENIVRQIKVRRRSAFPNKDQLVFCYKACCAYLDLFNAYSNFDLPL